MFTGCCVVKGGGFSGRAGKQPGGWRPGLGGRGGEGQILALFADTWTWGVREAKHGGWLEEERSACLSPEIGKLWVEQALGGKEVGSLCPEIPGGPLGLGFWRSGDAYTPDGSLGALSGSSVLEALGPQEVPSGGDLERNQRRTGPWPSQLAVKEHPGEGSPGGQLCRKG